MTYENICETRDYIFSHTHYRPTLAIILGSGLSPLADRIEKPETIAYKDIPHFPVSTVRGHKGNLVFGLIGGREVMCMQGRFHYYEGWEMDEVTFPERVMQLMGVKNLIVTNAAGGVDASFTPGDIMLITDHINRMPNPLRGRNDERFGERFPSMNEAYSLHLRELALNAARETGLDLKQGVYVANPGPSFETPAEYRMLRLVGAGAVGMSTVPEVIAAVHGGISVLALSVISNVFNEADDAPQTHQEVLDNVAAATAKMVTLVEHIIEKL